MFNGTACVHARPTALWYRIRMAASYGDDARGVDAHFGALGLPFDNKIRQQWSWTSNGAVILHRECTVVPPEGGSPTTTRRIAAKLDPRLPCEPQGRGAYQVIEDMSFGAAGVTVVTQDSTTHHTYPYVWVQPSGSPDSPPPPQKRRCSTTTVSTDLARPSHVPMLVSASQRAAAFQGLNVETMLNPPEYDEGLSFGTSSAGSCPELGDGESYLGGLGPGDNWPAGTSTGGVGLPKSVDMLRNDFIDVPPHSFGRTFSVRSHQTAHTFDNSGGEADQAMNTRITFAVCPDRGGRTTKGC